MSIVTPSLNQGAYIEETIRSVQEQDYPRIEHIVVDAQSSDGTLAVLERYPDIRWVSEADRGQADALNKGFRMARGEIFGWLNADDYLLPGAISAVVAVVRGTGCGLVHGGWRQIAEDGATIKDVTVVPFDFEDMLETRNTVAQPGSVFTREAFEAVGGIDASYHYAMDYELWLRSQSGSRYETSTRYLPPIVITRCRNPWRTTTSSGPRRDAPAARTAAVSSRRCTWTTTSRAAILGPIEACGRGEASLRATFGRSRAGCAGNARASD